MTPQKVNAALMTAICAVTLWPGNALAQKEDGYDDIIIDLTEWEKAHPLPTPPPEQPKVMDDVTKRLHAYTSLPHVWKYGDYTLSVFSKSSKWVVVGDVKEVRMFETKPMSLFNCTVSLSVDVCAHGKFPEKNVTFSILLRDDERQPILGDRMLVFLSDFRNMVALENKMKWMGLPCSFFRAYVFLDDKEEEKSVTDAVKKYIRTFNDGGKRNKDKYYEFLCSLLQSPVKRIRDDAEIDFLFFYAKEPSLDLEKALADDRVSKETKKYLRYLIRGEKLDE